MNGLALCAGAGGLELGLHIADPDYHTVCYVEREAYAAAALVARMEDATLDRAPIWDDVTTFNGRRWRGLVDIVAGGYPCQGESNAGRRLGVRDPRWLWPHFRRILVQTGAEWGFFENVGAHLSRSFPVVAGDLARLGYRVAAGLFTAAEAGGSHERERLFILAHRERGVGLADPTSWRRGQVLGGETAQRLLDADCADMANPIGIGCHEGWSPDPEYDRAIPGADRQHHLAHAGVSGLAGTEQPGQPGAAECGQREGTAAAELRGALPLAAPGPADPRWPEILDLDPTLEPSLCRMAHAMAYRVDRLRLTGNGVYPLAAALAYRTLRDALAGGGQAVGAVGAAVRAA